MGWTLSVSSRIARGSACAKHKRGGTFLLGWIAEYLQLSKLMRKKLSLEVFSMGYWGWGNHAEKLVEIIDLAEKEKGFRPPVFVDIRLRRSVRAKDFQNNNFEKIVGGERYLHLPSLGNANIGTGKRGIRIKSPAEVSTLLDIAVANFMKKRRVIYFCSCEDPKGCHREVVAKLLVAEARERELNVSTSDWPGGKPCVVELAVNKSTFKMVENQMAAIPLPTGARHLMALPWFSVVRFGFGGQTQPVHTGRAIFKRRWCLPYYETTDEASKVKQVEAGLVLQNKWGYDCKS